MAQDPPLTKKATCNSAMVGNSEGMSRTRPRMTLTGAKIAIDKRARESENKGHEEGLAGVLPASGWLRRRRSSRLRRPRFQYGARCHHPLPNSSNTV